jgi:hypothetical protein
MLSETNRIDIIAQSPEGEIILVITAAEDWSDEHALELLSDKIDTYVSFIKDPQFQDEYGSATAYIELVAMHEPTSQVQELLDAASAATGIRIGIRKMEIDIEGLLGGEPADQREKETAAQRSAVEGGFEEAGRAPGGPSVCIAGVARPSDVCCRSGLRRDRQQYAGGAVGGGASRSDRSTGPAAG